MSQKLIPFDVASFLDTDGPLVSISPKYWLTAIATNLSGQ